MSDAMSDIGGDENSAPNKGGEIVDPVSRRLWSSKERSNRSRIAVFKMRHRRNPTVPNQYFEKAGNIKGIISGDPKMGHKEPEQERDSDALAEDGGIHREHEWEHQIQTVYGARKAIEAARNLAEEEQEKLFSMIEKVHPQILTTRRRF